MGVAVDDECVRLPAGRVRLRSGWHSEAARHCVGRGVSPAVNARSAWEIAFTPRPSHSAEDLRHNSQQPSRHERLLPSHFDEGRLYAAVVRSLSDVIVSFTAADGSR
jgi:hypothetical protein